jgi:hypothetical protein
MVSNNDDTKDLESKDGEIKDNAGLFKKEEKLSWKKNKKLIIFLLICITITIICSIVTLAFK